MLRKVTGLVIPVSSQCDSKLTLKKKRKSKARSTPGSLLLLDLDAHLSHLHSALGAAGDDPDEGSVCRLRDVGQSHMDIGLAWCRCQVRKLEHGAHGGASLSVGIRSAYWQKPCEISKNP